MFLWRFLSKKSNIRYDLPVVLTIQEISQILCIEEKEAEELVSSSFIKTIPYLTKDRIFTNRFMEFINSNSGSPDSLKGEY